MSATVTRTFGPPDLVHETLLFAFAHPPKAKGDVLFVSVVCHVRNSSPKTLAFQNTLELGEAHCASHMGEDEVTHDTT